MDNTHPLSTFMVIRSLDVNKDPLWPLEEILEKKKVPYFSVIGALMYFTNYTKPKIAFAANLLAKYSSTKKKNIGMWSNIYFAISAKQLKWSYFIMDQIYNWLDMQIQVISLIPTKRDHKQVICLHIEVL